MYSVSSAELSHHLFTSLSKECRGHGSFSKQCDTEHRRFFIYSHLNHIVLYHPVKCDIMEQWGHRHKIELWDTCRHQVLHTGWVNCRKEFSTPHLTSFFFFCSKTLHLILNRLAIVQIVFGFFCMSDCAFQEHAACGLFSGFLLTYSAALLFCLQTALDS